MNNCVKRALSITACAAAIWFFLRYLIWWALPLLLAFTVSAALEPVTRRVIKTLKLKRSFAATIVTALFFALTGALVFFSAGRLIKEASALTGNLPRYIEPLLSIIRRLRENMYARIGGTPPELRGLLLNWLDSLQELPPQLPALLYGKAASAVSTALRAAPDIILAVLSFVTGTFFISAGFPAIRSFIARQIPENRRKWLTRLKGGILKTLALWFKAQFFLFCVTFSELFLAFTLLRTESAALLALITALIDALPVLGAGAVIVPWSLACLISGDTGRALCLITLYAVVTMVRSVLEVKLLGSGAGAHPAAALLAAYAGFRIAGTAGMVLFPLLLVLLLQFHDRGYIKLWK